MPTQQTDFRELILDIRICLIAWILGKGFEWLLIKNRKLVCRFRQNSW